MLVLEAASNVARSPALETRSGRHSSRSGQSHNFAGQRPACVVSRDAARSGLFCPRFPRPSDSKATIASAQDRRMNTSKGPGLVRQHHKLVLETRASIPNPAVGYVLNNNLRSLESTIGEPAYLLRIVPHERKARNRDELTRSGASRPRRSRLGAFTFCTRAGTKIVVQVVRRSILLIPVARAGVADKSLGYELRRELPGSDAFSISVFADPPWQLEYRSI